MTFKNRGRKKEYRGKCMDELERSPSYQWYKGKFIPSKDVPIRGKKEHPIKTVE